MGLKRKHHAELNEPWNVRPERYDELRQQYRGDKAAQQQIDVYAPDAVEYRARLRSYSDAVIRGDDRAAGREERWFRRHYPDIAGSTDDDAGGVGGSEWHPVLGLLMRVLLCAICVAILLGIPTYLVYLMWTAR